MRSICLIGVQVTVEREGWMIFAIDKLNLIMAYFKRKSCVRRNVFLNWCNIDVLRGAVV